VLHSALEGLDKARFIGDGRESDPSPDDRVVLIEEQTLLRESLAHLLATCTPDAQIEHFARVEDVPAGPASLVLIGADPARANAAEFAEEYWSIKEICGNAPIGAIALGDDADFLGGLRALGLVGIINQDSSAAVVVAAVKLMIVGGYCLPPETFLSRKLALAPVQAISAGNAPPESLENARAGLDELRLTARERDIMRCLREGRQNKSIAHELGISESTVKVHLRNIMKKLHASNRTQVALGRVWLD
jgi:DNA-binding NarL/FixJ family response regulator